MLVAFIHSLEITLIALLATLVFRVRNLYTAAGYSGKERIDRTIEHILHGDTAVNQYEIKMESLQKAQAFSGMQLIDIKRNYGDINQDSLAWLREAISLYLIGAIDLIGKEAKCSTKTRKDLIILVLKSNLRLSTESALAYYQEALYRTLSSDNDLMVRAGAKAAKNWSGNGHTPKEMSLTSQLDEWGIFA